MTRVLIGKIVGTHGIKGELKLLSDFEYLDRVLKANFPLYIGEETYYLSQYRFHKQYVLITLKTFFNINQVLHLIKQNVWVEESDLNLKEDEYLLDDLLNSQVYVLDKLIGYVEEIMKNKASNIVRVKTKKDTFLVPLVAEYVLKFVKDTHKLYLKKIPRLD